MLKTALLATIALSLLSAATYAAEDPAYSDDRSTPQTLIRSFYNAIDRKEYGRAWSYYGEQKPAADFEAFAKGYENTESVEILTGEPTSDGAAGSIYYDVPVAIRAHEAGSEPRTYAGCYLLRQINPAIQGADFKPIYLIKGAMAPHRGSLPDALPKKCGD